MKTNETMRLIFHPKKFYWCNFFSRIRLSSYSEGGKGFIKLGRNVVVATAELMLVPTAKCSKSVVFSRFSWKIWHWFSWLEVIVDNGGFSRTYPTRPCLHLDLFQS